VSDGARDRRQQAPLTTWKEIAAYLGVTVRTAQKWEQERGLPVHRVPGGRGRVWGKPAELDAWRASADGAAAGASEGRKSAGRVLSLAALALALATAGVVASRIANPRGAEPAWFQTEGNAFIVCDANGRELWRKPVPPGWRDQTVRGRAKAWIGDVSGDSGKEVLLAATGSTATMPLRLYCFDASGNELWRYQVQREVRTRDEVFRPPFVVAAFAVSSGKPRRIAVVSHHDSYFPTQVAILDGDGKMLSEYWHSGYLWAVVFADLDQDGRQELYLGGTSNARNMATLVVFDPDRVAGASAEPEPYQLLGLGPGTETARIFFPRTCVNRIAKQRNMAEAFRLSPPTLIVEVREGPAPGTTIFYHFHHFKGRLELEETVPSDGFLTLHQQLWRTGRIDHSWSREEEESLRSIIQQRRPDS